MGKAITIYEAVDIVQSLSFTPVTESVRYPEAPGRVLAEDVTSDVDFPPFNKSAMDGYACRVADLPGPLSVIEDIPAGKSPILTISPGTCSKIMTGAEVPKGADHVVMKEEAEISADGQVLLHPKGKATNISPKGEDIRSGDVVIKCGTLLNRRHISVLAGVGKSLVQVYRQPSVAVISTGSELVSPESLPGRAQIRNSNGPQLMSQLEEMGLRPVFFGIVKDQAGEIAKIISEAAAEHELVIITGGVSVGDYDYVPDMLQKLGFRLLITEIASKPGKHTILAHKGNRIVLGLPGNPVSTFMQMEFVGKILIFKMMGYDYTPLRLAVRMGEDFSRRHSDRFEFLPVRIDEVGKVTLIPYHGSAHIHAWTGATAILEIPQGVSKFAREEIVYVRPL